MKYCPESDLPPTQVTESIIHVNVQLAWCRALTGIPCKHFCGICFFNH